MMYPLSRESLVQTPGRVVAWIHVTDGAELESLDCAGPAANSRPAPTPGMYQDEEGARVYYVTARGQAYLVRSPEAPSLLQPVDALPVAEAALLEELDEDAYDRALCILAEAADALESESVSVGIYEQDGHYYYVNEDGVYLLYGVKGARRFCAVTLPELPVGAQMVAEDQMHELPAALYLAIDDVEERADASPQVQS